MRPQDHTNEAVRGKPLQRVLEQRSSCARAPVIRMNVQGKNLSNSGVNVAAADVDEPDNPPVHLGDQDPGATGQLSCQPRDPTFSSITDSLIQEPWLEEVSEANPPRFRMGLA